MPENATRTKDRELTELAACLAVLRTLDSNQTVGTYLLDMFMDKPYLVKYFKAAYDPTKVYGIRWEDVMDNVERAPRTHTDVPRAFGAVLARMADNPKDRAGSIAEWGAFIIGLQREQVEVANCILNKDLGCPNLPLGLLNKVLQRVGKEPLPEPKETKETGAPRGLAMFQKESNKHNTVYRVYWDGTTAGHLIIENSVHGQNAVRTLVATGVILAEPK